MTTKAYREANKDKINAYAKAYYAKNKDRIKANMKAYREQIVHCPCGATVTKHHYGRLKLADKLEHYETRMFVCRL